MVYNLLAIDNALAGICLDISCGSSPLFASQAAGHPSDAAEHLGAAVEMASSLG